MARASTVAWISVAMGMALAPAGALAQAPAAPAAAEATGQTDVRPSKTHLALKSAIDCYRKGEHEISPLRDVSLEIEKGDFVSLMGASGSGKSTLLNLIAGIDRPTSGEVSVAGSFNSWAPGANPLVRHGDAWQAEVEVTPGRHAYKFCVDGRWILDPANPETEKDREYTNSVLVVK